MKKMTLGIWCVFLCLCPLSLFAADLINTKVPESLQNVLSLSPEMFTIYREQEALYQQKLLQRHPIIVALINPTGGSLILYRPNQTPIIAPSLPQAQEYEVATVIEHTAMGLYALAMQSMSSSTTTIVWQRQMRSYQAKLTLAKSSISTLTISDDEKRLLQQILGEANVFITENLQLGSLSVERTNSYAQKLNPYFVQLSKLVVGFQVNHWIQIVTNWQQQLGTSWQNTYAVVMYINVPPSSNIFLDIIAHYMGQDAIGKRIYSFTADSYTPTPAQAFNLLGKALPDKTLANEVFGKYFFTNVTIVGQTAQNVIAQRNTS